MRPTGIRTHRDDETAETAIAITPKASATQVENSAEPRFTVVTRRSPIAAPVSSKPLAAVDRQHLPHDVARLVAAQEQHGVGDVVDVGDAAGGDGRA